MNIFLTLISQTAEPLFEWLFTKYMRFPWRRFSVLKLFLSSFQSREIMFVLQLPDVSSSLNKSQLINLFFAHFPQVFHVDTVKQFSLCSQLDCTLNQILNTIRKCFYKNPDEDIYLFSTCTGGRADSVPEICKDRLLSCISSGSYGL